MHLTRQLLLVSALVSAAAAQNVTPGADAAAKSGSLAGMVVNAQAGEPLKRVEVILSMDLVGGAPQRAITDSAGKFKVPGLAPGTYRVAVSRVGFVPAHASARDAATGPEIITLAASQEITGLVYRLIPGGVLTGRVVDEDGAPFAGVRLQCFKYSFTARARHLVTMGAAVSDDRGQYRIAGLPSGGYYVYASFSDAGALMGAVPIGAAEGYPALFYPGVWNAAQAAEIPVRAGEERAGVDFKLAPARLLSVRGTVRNPDGRPMARDAVAVLAPRASAGLGGRPPVRIGEDGGFRIDGVAPGSYLLTVLAGGGAGNTVRLPVEVADANIENLVVLVQPRIEVKGRVRVESDRPPKLDAAQLFLSPADGAGLMEGGSGVAAIRPDGTFVFPGVAEGDYALQADHLPDDCYVRDLLLAGRAAQDRVVHVSQATAGALELVLSDKGGRVDGTLKDDKQRPVSSSTVVLIPDASRRAQAELFRAVATDQYGHFTIRGVPKGDYKLFAWSDELEPWSWREPGVLAPYENLGKAITVEEGARVSVEFAPIPVQ